MTTHSLANVIAGGQLVAINSNMDISVFWNLEIDLSTVLYL